MPQVHRDRGTPSLRLLVVAILLALFAFPPACAQREDLIDPFTVDGDEELRRSPGVRGGSGTANDPYRIEGWQIDLFGRNQSGIRLTNTSQHLLLRNVRIENGAASVGLEILNSTNIRLERVQLVANKYGLVARGIPDLEAKDCDFSGNVLVGALFDRVDGGILYDSTVSRNAVGLRWMDSKDVNGRNLTLTGNGRGADQQRPALHLMRVEGARFEGVTAKDNADDGLTLEDVNGVELRDVTSELNRAAGIRVTTGEDVTMTGVQARGNGGNGITIESVQRAGLTDVHADLNQRNGVQFTAGDGPRFTDVTTERNSRHGIIAADVRDGVFTDGTSQYNGGSGLMLVGHGNVVRGNTIYRNTEATAALWLQGDANQVRNNSIRQNSGWGIYIIVGHDNVVEQNRIDGNGQGDIYSGPAQGDNVIQDNEGDVRYFQTKPLPSPPLVLCLVALIWLAVRQRP